MSRVLISPYSAVLETVRRHRPSHLLTLMVDPYVETPDGIAPERHLRLHIHDIVEPAEGTVCPSPSHIGELLAFARSWDREQPLLVHCWAGISRSTAAAFVVLCDIHGPGHELTLARALRFHAPHAHPNRALVRHADDALGRQGRMIAAVEAMGEARQVWEGEVVELPLSLDEL